MNAAVRSAGVSANDRRQRGIFVEVVAPTGSDRAASTLEFWRLVGDLVADVVLDGAEGPWDGGRVSSHATVTG